MESGGEPELSNDEFSERKLAYQARNRKTYEICKECGADYRQRNGQERIEQAEDGGQKEHMHKIHSIAGP